MDETITEVFRSIKLDKAIGTKVDQSILSRIEQITAKNLDIVKAHLTYVVRKEVEALKEQVACLIERNKQLEYENRILREAASPETLALLVKLR